MNKVSWIEVQTTKFTATIGRLKANSIIFFRQWKLTWGKFRVYTSIFNTLIVETTRAIFMIW